MNITNSPYILSSQNVQGLQRTHVGKGGAESTGSATTLKDSVVFSEEALRLSETNEAGTESTRIRFDLVNRVKAEIAAGMYDTSDKMDIALDRMVNRIF